ncbi:hypothetical protein E3P92_00328 [Wallemia ichthyophaga]|uniref:Anaphase-promoting complex subunit 11 n=1 Tax=Wallemia ichthyophaga TaxID=245174 RepID=A0A4T0GRZ0_WALIC|nr:hypothetical protein E3P91_00684 [Wallemia ichthyophaga]TIA80775.1 hypothetical protein E3P98_02519 [Wallemia ichthyophaga]TIA89618.1 hypothetical protein E3P97_02958 [Wallemia ichthyophaga]TIB03729.1 hypothetical protein E3P95_00393 [Wallemia ichthyophaga]TIB04974.1 hypothetical protein E3P94_00393 [Wallemia ichthyophaga]
MRVTINQWRAFSHWKWNGCDTDDLCGICQNYLDNSCPNCSLPGDDCPLIWGKCNHSFHMHCILKWLSLESSKGQCPMDRQQWGK